MRPTTSKRASRSVFQRLGAPRAFAIDLVPRRDRDVAHRLPSDRWISVEHPVDDVMVRDAGHSVRPLRRESRTNVPRSRLKRLALRSLERTKMSLHDWRESGSAPRERRKAVE